MTRYECLIGIEQKKKPTCEAGEFCDPHENPAHHVEVFIGEDILRPMRAALRRLKAAHAGSLDVWHGQTGRWTGGPLRGKPCADCRAIEDMTSILKRITGRPL